MWFGTCDVWRSVSSASRRAGSPALRRREQRLTECRRPESRQQVADLGGRQEISERAPSGGVDPGPAGGVQLDDTVHVEQRRLAFPQRNEVEVAPQREETRAVGERVAAPLPRDQQSCRHALARLEIAGPA